LRGVPLRTAAAGMRDFDPRDPSGLVGPWKKGHRHPGCCDSNHRPDRKIIPPPSELPAVAQPGRMLNWPVRPSEQRVGGGQTCSCATYCCDGETGKAGGVYRLSAEHTEISGVVRGPSADAAVRNSAPRGRLFRKYVLFFVSLVAVALLVNGGFDFWFGYQENKAALVRVQQEKADAASQRIAEFVDEIERQIGWTTHAEWSAAPLDQRRFDYVRLL